MQSKLNFDFPLFLGCVEEEEEDCVPSANDGLLNEGTFLLSSSSLSSLELERAKFLLFVLFIFFASLYIACGQFPAKPVNSGQTTVFLHLSSFAARGLDAAGSPCASLQQIIN